MTKFPDIDDVAEMCYNKGFGEGYERGYNDRQYSFQSLLGSFVLGAAACALLYPIISSLIKQSPLF